MTDIKDARILIIATDGFEQSELEVPRDKLKQAGAKVYDALIIPGSQINPDKLRVEKQAMTLVKDFIASGKPVAAICHGPWLLVEADAVKGRDVTSYHSIRRDVENAGGNWIDRPVVVDEGIITSRSPDDLNAFVKKIIEEVAKGPHPRG